MATSSDRLTREKLVRRIPTMLALLLCALGIALNFTTIGPGTVSSSYHRHSDFRHFYLGAKLIGGELYDVDRMIEAQSRLYGGVIRSLGPTRLPFYYAFLSPLAGLPYSIAQGVWLAAMTLATALFIWIGWPAGSARVAIACCWSWPLLFSLPLGQDSALVLLLLGAAGRAAYARRNWWLAGLLLSLCLIKFNLIVLLPLLIIGKRKWRLGAGFLAGAVCLAVISFSVAGWNWPRPYVSLIADPLVSPGLAAMPNLRGLMFNLHGAGAWEYVISSAVIAMVWWIVRHRPFGVASAATLLGSMLLSQHSYLQDCSLLIPALLVLVRRPSSILVRCCAWALMLPVAYVVAFFTESGAAPAVLVLALLIGMTLDSHNRCWGIRKSLMASRRG